MNVRTETGLSACFGYTEISGLMMSDELTRSNYDGNTDNRFDPEFAFARKPGADAQLTFEQIDLSMIDEAKVFHFGTLSLTDEPARTSTYKAVPYGSCCKQTNPRKNSAKRN